MLVEKEGCFSADAHAATKDEYQQALLVSLNNMINDCQIKSRPDMRAKKSDATILFEM
jgi:hypothetical protein